MTTNLTMDTIPPPSSPGALQRYSDRRAALEVGARLFVRWLNVGVEPALIHKALNWPHDGATPTDAPGFQHALASAFANVFTAEHTSWRAGGRRWEVEADSLLSEWTATEKVVAFPKRAPYRRVLPPDRRARYAEFIFARLDCPPNTLNPVVKRAFQIIEADHGPFADAGDALSLAILLDSERPDPQVSAWHRVAILWENRLPYRFTKRDTACSAQTNPWARCLPPAFVEFWNAYELETKLRPSDRVGRVSALREAAREIVNSVNTPSLDEAVARTRSAPEAFRLWRAEYVTVLRDRLARVEAFTVDEDALKKADDDKRAAAYENMLDLLVPVTEGA